jgi:hypothetical protein
VGVLIAHAAMQRFDWGRRELSLGRSKMARCFAGVEAGRSTVPVDWAALPKRAGVQAGLDARCAPRGPGERGVSCCIAGRGARGARRAAV